MGNGEMSPNSNKRLGKFFNEKHRKIVAPNSHSSENSSMKMDGKSSVSIGIDSIDQEVAAKKHNSETDHSFKASRLEYSDTTSAIESRLTPRKMI